MSAHLITQGYQVPITRPRQVTADQVARADVVISLGCDLTGLPITTEVKCLAHRVYAP